MFANSGNLSTAFFDTFLSIYFCKFAISSANPGSNSYYSKLTLFIFFLCLFFHFLDSFATCVGRNFKILQISYLVTTRSCWRPGRPRNKDPRQPLYLDREGSWPEVSLCEQLLSVRSDCCWSGATVMFQKVMHSVCRSFAIVQDYHLDCHRIIMLISVVREHYHGNLDIKYDFS